MTSKLVIDQHDLNATEYAINRAANEGWNPGLDDADTFIHADPNGFFVAKMNCIDIGCASAICYDNNYAFFGLYVIEEEYRGLGYGMQLTQKRLDYVGDRCTGLDGVLENEDMYAKIGFKTVYINRRYAIQAKGYTSSDNLDCVQSIDCADIPRIIQYDQLAFPAPRAEFLQAWLNAPHHKAYAIYDDTSIKGYAVIRQCVFGYKVGPLFADNIDDAKLLLDACLSEANDTVYIDIAEINAAAQELISLYPATSEFACARMYRNGMPDHDTNRVFGITTFELG